MVQPVVGYATTGHHGIYTTMGCTMLPATTQQAASQYLHNNRLAASLQAVVQSVMVYLVFVQPFVMQAVLVQPVVVHPVSVQPVGV